MAHDNAIRTALVTGAGRRLGRGIALHLARRGWRVGVHYNQSEEDAAALVETIAAEGGKALALRADLSKVEELEPLVAACAARLGVPSLLVNNAARFEWDDIADLDPAGWQAHLDTNLRAPVFLVRAFARALPEPACGNVINMIDQKVLRLDPEFFSYTIAKSALWTATVLLAQALAPRIRVNAVAPGPVLPSRKQSEAEFEAECRSTPLGRGATPEEVCAAVDFLLGAPSVTGAIIPLDGGQHLAWR
jgi:NAD(P)-dependent dehydrogenase (short-subunit alcohol dehydrogenase family)